MLFLLSPVVRLLYFLGLSSALVLFLSFLLQLLASTNPTPVAISGYESVGE
jgi:hypothetical protein